MYCQKYEQNSNEGKILDIVEKHTPEIYKENKRFSAIIGDYFPNENIGELLRVIIDKKASIDVYKLKSSSNNDLKREYLMLLDKLSKTTFIAKEILIPAIKLLGIGLELDFGEINIPTPLAPISIPNITPPTTTAPSQTITPKPVQTVDLGDLLNFKIENGVLIKYFGDNNNVITPNSVTAIDEYAFSDCTKLVNISISNTVTSIGSNAFNGCTSLKNVSITDSVTSIGYDVFVNCTSLTNISIPNSITEIEYGMFNGCISLKNVSIPNSVTSISLNAFRDCKSLTNIAIPKRVSFIGDGAFRDCISLTTISIPDYVNLIKDDAFKGCVSLNKAAISRLNQLGYNNF